MHLCYSTTTTTTTATATATIALLPVGRSGRYQDAEKHEIVLA